MRASASCRAVSITIGIEAGLAGHHDVEDQEIEMQPHELRACIAGACGGSDAITFAGEEARQQIADAAVVVDQQQMRRIVGRFYRRAGERGSERHVHSFPS
jgi:hypothetical protein